MPRPASRHVLQALRDHVCAGRVALGEEAWLDAVHRGVPDAAIAETILGGALAGWAPEPGGRAAGGVLRAGAIGVSFRIGPLGVRVTGVFFLGDSSTLFDSPRSGAGGAAGRGSKSLRVPAGAC